MYTNYRELLKDIPRDTRLFCYAFILGVLVLYTVNTEDLRHIFVMDTLLSYRNASAFSFGIPLMTKLGVSFPL